jgi:hypothetical protein
MEEFILALLPHYPNILNHINVERLTIPLAHILSQPSPRFKGSAHLRLWITLNDLL